MIKAAFFDIDGTLFSHTIHAIPESTRRTVNLLREKGIKVFIATGRSLKETKRVPLGDMKFDGYVTLTGGSGVSTDYTTATTTMRWAQIFCSETNGTPGACTTAGITTTRATTANSITGIDASWTALGLDGESQADDEEIQDNKTTVTSSGTTQGNSYDIIKMNYIRVSKHTGTRYTQVDDVTSALVYNQYLNAKDDDAGNDTGDSYNSNSTTTDKTYKDAQVYYIAVWLSETGTNQTIGSGGTSVPNETANFFQGSVTFISAQGSEVTATFAGYDVVTPDTQS